MIPFRIVDDELDLIVQQPNGVFLWSSQKWSTLQLVAKNGPPVFLE